MPKSTIALQLCESSRICAHGYDSNRKVLALQFKNKSGDPGPVYEYANVASETHQQWLEATSKGQFFGAVLNNKDKFPYTRMVDDEPTEKDAA